MGRVRHTLSAKPTAGATIYDVYDTSLDFLGSSKTRSLALKTDAVNDAISSGTFTIICNVKFDTFESVDTIFACWDASSSNRSFWARFRSSGICEVFTSSTGTSTGGRTYTGALGLSTATWYQFAICGDMSNATANDRIKIHINGVEQSTTTSNANHSGGIHALDYTTDGDYYCFGGRPSAATGNSLKGDQHEWTILDTNLSEAECSAIWNSGTPLSPRDSHNANVVCRVNSDSGTWNALILNFEFDCDILGSGVVVTQTYSSAENTAGVLDPTGGIY